MDPRDEQQENPEEEVAVEEGEDFGDREGVSLDFLEERKPSTAEILAAKAAVAAERTGVATRRLLEGVGSKLETPAPPSDDLRDLFEGPDMERDADVYIKDLVTIEEEDVFGDGGADMSDLLEVTEEDIMGEEDYIGYGEERPSPPEARRVTPRIVPPTGVSELR